MPGKEPRLSRRTALKGMTGLVLGVYLKPGSSMAQSGAAQILRPDSSTSSFAPNAFVRIGTDDTVTVLVKHIEFGQGPFTGLATLVAEELDADWSKVRAEHAPADANLYKNFLLGSQGTGGSTAIANSYEQMRKAGAAARAMLVEAAAQSWRVPAGEISVERGVLRHSRSNRQGRFGQFAEVAAKGGDPRTIADGLRSSLGVKTFAVLSKLVDAIGTTSEPAIVQAMRLAWEKLKLIIEPSSAVPLAALLERKLPVAGRRVGIVISGGNVDLDRLPWQH